MDEGHPREATEEGSQRRGQIPAKVSASVNGRRESGSGMPVRFDNGRHGVQAGKERW
ncbi:hypothetical protein GCM10010191_75770 [Actinomadura vinacea]|uniref:DUF397 domain-containing protein n=1 Tax=Actinomadura vinacea TaxID=115336 RepID=A0ABN3K284_9ACTN